MIIFSQNFRYQPFLAVSDNLGGKVSVVDDVLSSHEEKLYPIISMDENSIGFEFQTDCNYYVDLRQSCLAPKVKQVNGSGFDIYTVNEAKKDHTAEEWATEDDYDESTDDENMESIPFVSYVNHINHSVFSNVEVYISNQQI